MNWEMAWLVVLAFGALFVLFGLILFLAKPAREHFAKNWPDILVRGLVVLFTTTAGLFVALALNNFANERKEREIFGKELYALFLEVASNETTIRKMQYQLSECQWVLDSLKDDYSSGFLTGTRLQKYGGRGLLFAVLAYTHSIGGLKTYYDRMKTEFYAKQCPIEETVTIREKMTFSLHTTRMLTKIIFNYINAPAFRNMAKLENKFDAINKEIQEFVRFVSGYVVENEKGETLHLELRAKLDETTKKYEGFLILLAKDLGEEKRIAHYANASSLDEMRKKTLAGFESAKIKIVKSIDAKTPF